jgi:hypothetical protein
MERGAMRQERMQKRSLRRPRGGGDSPSPLGPVPTRDAATRRTIEKTDDLLRRMERLVSSD